MQNTIWNIKNKHSLNVLLKQDKYSKIDHDILRILKARGVVTKKQVKDFLFPKLENLQDPKSYMICKKLAKE